ncbi:MAG: HAMP domain-containing protein [Rhizobacter sp.]|nr:HAMP domain-containing protein [Chlorobiales bacterium]
MEQETALQVKENVPPNKLIERFLSMKIRLKLSLIIGGVLVVVLSILMTAVLTQQQNVLTERNNAFCQLLVRNLSGSAKENLMLGAASTSASPATFILIQEAISNINKQRLDGVNWAYVADRNGSVVAHSDLSLINQSAPKLPPAISEKNLSNDSLGVTIHESREDYIYTDSIFVQRITNVPSAAVGKSVRATQKLFLGVSRISFSKAALYEPIAVQRRNIVLIGLAVLAVSIVLVVLMARPIVAAILAISDAARKVGSGDLTVTVMLRTRDELGELASDFNRMVQDIREKRSMQRFMSDLTVEMIKQSGQEISLGGERRLITVMFTDVRGFTSMSEQMEPESVVEVINVYLNLQTDVIQRHGGSVDKFLGDGIMALFTGDKMTDRAIEAALEIQQAIQLLNAQRSQTGVKEMAVGIGINSGYAVLGNIGAQSRMDFTAIGDTVNLASRLCSASAPFATLVSEGVLEYAQFKYLLKNHQEITVKGKAKPVQVYEVAGVTGDPNILQPTVSVAADAVGAALPSASEEAADERIQIANDGEQLPAAGVQDGQSVSQQSKI